MAVNKTINKRTNTHGAMRNCIEYVLRQDKTSEPLVFLSDLVIHAIVNKKIILEDWLLVISGYTGWKASGGCFHVSIPMINPDYHNCFISVIFHHSHNHTSFFLFLSNPINTYVN